MLDKRHNSIIFWQVTSLITKILLTPLSFPLLLLSDKPLHLYTWNIYFVGLLVQFQLFSFISLTSEWTNKWLAHSRSCSHSHMGIRNKSTTKTTLLFTVEDELILKMSGWVYNNLWVTLSRMHLFFVFLPVNKQKRKSPKLSKASHPSLREAYSMCTTPMWVCVHSCMHTHVYAVRPCQRSAFRQVFELLHHLVLLLREHEFCFTLLSK